MLAGFQTVVATLRRSEQALAKQLENVRSAIGALTSGGPGRKAGRPAGKKRGRPKGSGKKRGRPVGRKMSAAARKKMSDAAKKRWAARKNESK
jgi:hypothetical protein